jgi:hypothetical protein
MTEQEEMPTWVKWLGRAAMLERDSAGKNHNPPLFHKLLLARRQSLLIELGAIEDYLGMERSVVPKHRR